MAHSQKSASSDVDKEAPPSLFGVPDMPPPPQPVAAAAAAAAGYPGTMENYEMERYVLQSLELLASTPTTQFYGSEVPRNDVIPNSPRTALGSPWDGRTSFQQVHQRVIGGQEPDQQQQQCYPISSTSSSQSPTAPTPIYTHLNYHDHAIPEDASASESNAQGIVVEPTLKRQRNTAASARFRAKKKRNEQIQAQSAREREAVINRLENRVTELETENRWLKDLLIDKAEASARIDNKAIADDRKGYERKDGVGTAPA